MNWTSWGFGGKSIFVCFCVAVISMLVPWVDIGLASSNGISQGAVLFLILWIYPMYKLFKNKPASKILNVLLALTSCGLTVIYIASKQVDWFGKSVNVASTGAILYLLASVCLIFASLKYKPTGE